MSLSVLLMLAGGLVMLVVGAEVLVRGAARMAATFGMSALLVGLTVVALGTSAPEAAVTVKAALTGQADIAVGNVVGSNILNILLVLGLAAAISPLIVRQNLVVLDVPIMLGASLVLLLFSANGSIGRAEGVILLAGIASYLVIAVRQSSSEPDDVREEYEQEYGKEVQQRKGSLVMDILLVVAGLVLLVLGARWLVNGATVVAAALGVSELVIGLTVVAGGTSLPELATSVIASIRGERDIAVGNAVGSCIFNILFVLGLAGVLAPDGLPVSRTVMALDMPVMVAVAVASLPVFFTGHRIDRWEGFLFVGYYAAYLVYLFFDSAGHIAADTFGLVIGSFVVPLTLITLLVLAGHQMQAARARDPGR